jgi:amino acid permease
MLRQLSLDVHYTHTKESNSQCMTKVHNLKVIITFVYYKVMREYRWFLLWAGTPTYISNFLVNASVYKRRFKWAFRACNKGLADFPYKLFTLPLDIIQCTPVMLTFALLSNWVTVSKDTFSYSLAHLVHAAITLRIRPFSQSLPTKCVFSAMRA